MQATTRAVVAALWAATAVAAFALGRVTSQPPPAPPEELASSIRVALGGALAPLHLDLEEVRVRFAPGSDLALLEDAVDLPRLRAFVSDSRLDATSAKRKQRGLLGSFVMKELFENGS